MSEATEVAVGTKKSTKKSAKTVAKTVKTSKSTKARGRKKTVDLETFTALQEQIAANQKELLDSISASFQTTLNIQLKRADRRRRWNNFFRDIIILILALGLSYTGYMLYSLGYRLEGTELVNTNNNQQEDESTKPIKDDAWYLANYSYLLDQVQTDLNADSVSAYYLYSDDYKISDIKPEYLLNIAYQQAAREQATAAETNSESTETSSTKNDVISVPVNTVKNKFTELFGETVKFYAGNFGAGCLNFIYQHTSDTFEAKNQTCALNQHREIIEKIERIYQEGEVIYLITNAGIYDKDEHGFYNFNDLFRPIAKDVEKEDFNEYKNQLNRYQYQFKKSGDKFYFSKITKLD